MLLGSVVLLIISIIAIVLSTILSSKSNNQNIEESEKTFFLQDIGSAKDTKETKLEYDTIAKNITAFHFPISNVLRPHCRAVVLIIAGSAEREYTELYENFQTILEKYAFLHPNFMVVYLKCELSDTAPFIRWDTSQSIPSVIVNMCESFQPGIVYKTLAGMKAVSEYVDFQYLIRSNLSSFLNWESLDKFLNTLPLTNIYAGHLNGPINCGFCAGPITLSKDMVLHILESATNRSGEIDWIKTADDVILGQIVNWKLGEKNRIHIEGGWFTDHTQITEELKDKLKSESSKIWFRVRNPDINRTEIDTFVHKYLLQACYGIEI